jgi:glycerol-3-phosphate acyltransferase PlsY
MSAGMHRIQVIRHRSRCGWGCHRISPSSFNRYQGRLPLLSIPDFASSLCFSDAWHSTAIEYTVGMNVVLLIFSYLLGALPVGLLIGKGFRGIDVREHGSGNIGATNVWRTLGPVLGTLTFALDVAKGLIPVLLARHFYSGFVWLPVAAGILAIIGHNFSIFLGFQGGKGVATTLGVAFGLSWAAALIAFLVWGLVLLATRYISVSSLVATPIGAICLWGFNRWNWAYGLFALLATLFVVLKHRANIIRLRLHTEPRVTRRISGNSR